MKKKAVEECREQGVTVGERRKQGLAAHVALATVMHHGYETDGKDFLDVTWSEDPSWAWTAGGLVSSIDDLTQFYDDLLGGKVLAPAELQEMTTMVDITWPTIPEDGLGLAKRKFGARTAVGHEGGVLGFVSASFKFSDPEATVSVLINLESGDAARIVGDLAKILQTP